MQDVWFATVPNWLLSTFEVVATLPPRTHISACSYDIKAAFGPINWSFCSHSVSRVLMWPMAKNEFCAAELDVRQIEWIYSKLIVQAWSEILALFTQTVFPCRTKTDKHKHINFVRKRVWSWKIPIWFGSLRVWKLRFRDTWMHFCTEQWLWILFPFSSIVVTEFGGISSWLLQTERTIISNRKLLPYSWNNHIPRTAWAKLMTELKRTYPAHFQVVILNLGVSWH